MPAAAKKPKGKKSAYNYFLKHTCDEHKKKYPNEKLDLKTLSGQCSAKWKEIDEKQKKRFIELAEKDKARYEKEMENFAPNDQENKTKSARVAAKATKATKAKKDPNAPKRPLSAYLLYSVDIRPQVKSENPNLKAPEIVTEIANRWKTVSATVKARYESMAAKAKQDYTVELAEYNTNGRTPLKVKSPNKKVKGKASNSTPKRKQPVVQKEESEEESEDEESEESEEDESHDDQQQQQKSKDEEMDEESESSGDESE